MPRSLTVGPDDWLTQLGRQTNEELVITLVGPPLPGDRPGWATVTGYRDLPGEDEKAWTIAIVRRSAIPDGADGDVDRPIAERDG